MTNSCDVLVIGGGAAGQMAAISAKKHYPDYSVLLVDRTFALGRKILICGAGRCNVTNVNLDKSIADHYYGAPLEFTQGVFEQFNYASILDFFRDLGVELYVERKTNIGKLFPVTDQAKTITALLEDELVRLGVEIRLETEVRQLVQNGDQFKIELVKLDKTGKVLSETGLTAANVILAAGGKTYPALGSNGSGYMLAEKLGHSLIEPVPSALPLEGKNPVSQELQGTKLELAATSIIGGKEVKTRVDDVMFTKYGLSGPAILNISREISLRLNREKQGGVEVKLNFFPGKSTPEVADMLEQRWHKRPNQEVEKSLYGLFPNKLPKSILRIIEVSPTKPVSQLTEVEKLKLVNLLSDYRVKISATRGWNEAEFTAGGVKSEEVMVGTLESKLHQNLYFCGEILDVDGDVGGFNLSWAWASGFVAGKLS